MSAISFHFPRETMRIFYFLVFLNLLSNAISLETRTGEVCNPNQCCKTTFDGVQAELCPTQDPNVFAVLNYPAPIIVQQPFVPQIFKDFTVDFERSTFFTIRVLSMNVWGFNVWAEEKGTRMPAIASFLRQSNHDIVFIQEAWYHADFQVLKDTFPYSTFYGTPGSILCPTIRNDQSFYFQVLPFDCHGLMILSKHNILSTEYIFFQDRIPEARELFARRGALAATIEVSKAVAGVTKTLKVSAINTHLATWYSETESLWTSVREKQADEDIAMVAVHKEKSDLVVIAGDLNSTPESAVYKKFLTAGLVDTLVDLKDTGAANTKYVTWGHEDNTWSGPDGLDDHQDRLDYMLYTHSNNITVRTSAYGLHAVYS